MRRTVIDRPCQFKGKHWRQPGNPFWIPPKGLVYDPEHFETSPKGYIKATNGADVRIYESVTAAARFMDVDRRTLTGYIGKGKEFNKFVWTELPFNEWGTWSTTEQADDTLGGGEAGVSAIVLGDSGVNGCCNGKIISHDLSTGEEVMYNSVTRAAAFNMMSAHALKDNFVDKPRHANGKHFRSFTSNRLWSPPAYFKFNASGFEKKTGGYVISTDLSGGNKVMYESVKAAAELADDVKIWGIQQNLNIDKPYQGRVWKTAAADEYDVFVDV